MSAKRRVRWEPIDMPDGVWEACNYGPLRVYVRPDGTWSMRARRKPNWWWNSDYKTRGTNLDLGKNAVVAYIQKHFLL